MTGEICVYFIILLFLPLPLLLTGLFQNVDLTKFNSQSKIQIQPQILGLVVIFCLVHVVLFTLPFSYRHLYQCVSWSYHHSLHFLQHGWSIAYVHKIVDRMMLLYIILLDRAHTLQ